MKSEQVKERLESLLHHWLTESPLRSQWLKANGVSIYVRKTPHYDGKIRHPCFTLANISVPPSLQRKGIFTAVMEWAIGRPEFKMVKVENVLNPEFASYFRDQHWSANNQEPPSFHMWLD